MILCIKCREKHDGNHVCIEEMTFDQLLDRSLREVRELKSKAIREGFKTMEGAAKVVAATPCPDMRKQWSAIVETLKATVPPGQRHDDKGFKP